MNRGHGPNEHKSWGWFIGLLVGFLLMIFGNISSAYTTPPGTAPAMETKSPLGVNITSVTAPEHPCLLASSPATIATHVYDIGGTIVKVEFYDGSTLLGSLTAAPYTFTWKAPSKGTHTLTAKAFDNYNYNATSTPMIITVFTGCSSSPVLSVKITSPVSNTTLSAPVVMQATAEEDYTPASSAITKVEFYANNILLGQASRTPYSFTWPNPPPGRHTLTARAYDQNGHKASSAPISVIVRGGAQPTPSPRPTPSATPTPTPRPVPTATPVKSSTSCRVSYQLVSQWDGGFSVNMVLTNTGSVPIEGWILAFTFSGDQQITNLWNGNLSQKGQQVTITNAGWNGTIAPGNAANLGFNGAWTNSNPSPNAFTLNGQACSTA